MTVLHSGLRLVTPPTEEPISLDDAKNFLRVDVDLDEDDDLITGYIIAARRVVELYTRTQLVSATYLYALDSFWGYEVPGGTILLGSRAVPQQRGGGGWGWPYRPIVQLPRWPVQSATIQYIDTSGVLQTLATDQYQVDTISMPARISPAWGKVWPTTREVMNAVQVTFIAGFGDAEDVPETSKVAMRMLIGGWYQNRETVTDPRQVTLPVQLQMLLGIDDTGAL